MHVSCSMLVCPQKDYPRVEDALGQIQALGFRAFDLAAFEGWQNVNPSLLAEAAEPWTGRFARAVAAAGMTVSSINCSPSRPLDDPDPASFERYEREFAALLALAERVGCPNITVQPGGALEGWSFPKLFDTAAAHLATLGRSCEGHGVALSVEGHQGSLLEKPADGLRLMESLWPRVGFTYDPSHFVMQGIPLEETEPLLDYSVHVHVRNASPGQMQDTMEAGRVDFGWLVAALAARGYTGALTLEYFAGFDKGFASTLALRERLLELGVEA